MSIIKFLPEKTLLDLIKSLQTDISNETEKTLNGIFKELIEANIHSEVVKLLLANDKVDPSADNNWAIRLASNNGHLEVVKLLLANDKVDPSADNNWAIRLASNNGHLEVVKLLIPRVDMSKITNTKILDIAKELTPFSPLCDQFLVDLFPQLRERNILKIIRDGDHFLVEYKF